MNKMKWFMMAALLAGVAEAKPSTGGAQCAPNIVYILADDMGYGDVSVPSVDRDIGSG